MIVKVSCPQIVFFLLYNVYFNRIVAKKKCTHFTPKKIKMSMKIVFNVYI